MQAGGHDPKMVVPVLIGSCSPASALRADGGGQKSSSEVRTFAVVALALEVA